jgi:hypothetical protein
MSNPTMNGSPAASVSAVDTAAHDRIMRPFRLHTGAMQSPPRDDIVRLATSGRLVLVADRLVDGTGRPALEVAFVAIEAERIAAVGSGSRAEGRLPESVKCLDFPRCTILPGLVDSGRPRGDAWTRPGRSTPRWSWRCAHGIRTVRNSSCGRIWSVRARALSIECSR